VDGADDMKVKIVLGTFLLSVSLAARIKAEGEVEGEDGLETF
jgi:hypothetical protein